MQKIQKANKMIELLNQAETLATELGINDHERFDALRYWASLAKELEQAKKLDLDEA
jgi:hypothetical protein